MKHRDRFTERTCPKCGGEGERWCDAGCDTNGLIYPAGSKKGVICKECKGTNRAECPLCEGTGNIDARA